MSRRTMEEERGRRKWWWLVKLVEEKEKVNKEMRMKTDKNK